MSMSDRARSLGQHSSLLKREVARGKVEAYHVGFAQVRRPGTSWQNLAGMLGVNARDLERACAVAAAEADAPKPPPAPRRLEAVVLVEEGPVRGGSLGHRVLAAMARGVAPEPAHIERALDHPGRLTDTFRRLVEKGLLTQAGRFSPYAMTDLARAELERLGSCSHV